MAVSYYFEKDGRPGARRKVEDILIDISNLASGLSPGKEKVAVLGGMTVILSKFDCVASATIECGGCFNRR
jgi:hypothetical protein